MGTARSARWCLAALAVSAPLTACGDSSETSAATTTGPPVTTSKPAEAKASLAAPDGAQVGTVTFSSVPGGTEVDVQITANKAVAAGRFHGIHVHANDDPANGAGCKADPAAAAPTWFTAVDGHLRDGSATHNDHKGDLPSLLVRRDGTASLRFTSDRFTSAEVVGKAVVVHASADNFGNIPTGTLPDQYKPNTAEASTKTAGTGNAGDRVACGLVTGA